MQPINIADREYSHLLPIEQERLFDESNNYLFDTSYLAVISVEGEKASEFLQGQLTCDLNEISSTSAHPALYCNAKGKIICYFYIYQESKDKINLIMAEDISTDTIRILNRYAPFSRVKITRRKLRVFGLLDNNAVVSINPTERIHQLKIDNNRHLLIIDNENAPALWQNFYNKQTARGSYAWHYLNMENKNFNLYPLTQIHFFPHRLDLHKTSSISFGKGCYVGQEIIARTHYKAKPKYGLFFYTVKLHKPPQLKQNILTEENKKLGEVVDYCPLSKEDYLLATTLLLDHPLEAFLGDTKVYLHNHA